MLENFPGKPVSTEIYEKVETLVDGELGSSWVLKKAVNGIVIDNTTNSQYVVSDKVTPLVTSNIYYESEDIDFDIEDSWKIVVGVMDYIVIHENKKAIDEGIIIVSVKKDVN